MSGFRRGLGLALAIAALCGFAWLVWNPYAASEQRFDHGRNGLWIGHQWYTGRNVRSDEPVGADELERLVANFDRHRIRWAYVHVGPVLADGSTEDAAGPLFAELRRLAPDVRFLGWLGGIVERLPIDTPEWRSAVVRSVERLRDEGFDGVQLNVEPLADHHPGYLELLGEVREVLGPDFILSHATRRAGPFGIAVGPLEPLVWSEAFYRKTMALTDQTVLMAYDTKMDVAKHYVGFVKHQTGLLVRWACESPGHRVLIGIPSYEDVPLYSNPEIENIGNATQGVRSALEDLGRRAGCFEGVSVYANWVTDEDEWRDYRRHWLDPGLRKEP